MMSPKRSVVQSTIGLFLASWIVAFSLCGVDSFVSAIVGLPHHNSHSTDINVKCEQACLARSVSSPEAAVAQQGALPLQLELQAVGDIADSPLFNVGILSNLPYTLIGYPSSTKLYQRVSTYRL